MEREMRKLLKSTKANLRRYWKQNQMVGTSLAYMGNVSIEICFPLSEINKNRVTELR